MKKSTRRLSNLSTASNTSEENDSNTSEENDSNTSEENEARWRRENAAQEEKIRLEEEALERKYELRQIAKEKFDKSGFAVRFGLKDEKVQPVLFICVGVLVFTVILGVILGSKDSLDDSDSDEWCAKYEIICDLAIISPVLIVGFSIALLFQINKTIKTINIYRSEWIKATIAELESEV